MKVWLLHDGHVIGQTHIERDSRVAAIEAANNYLPRQYHLAKMSESPVMRIPGQGFYVCVDSIKPLYDDPMEQLRSDIGISADMIAAQSRAQDMVIA
ncbi:conserved hypothetical protein [Delftia phage PhiW-14]|uniref:Uncharacterized protein n=1 Tax=Delftia phage PhiW-14 TaxID=665032 RepID=C9DG91_BPW14|nr:hypothetical protein DP-phiW-14_gp121 [Delftia phage PhiW-14]ACV50142.1 conserved hypothetical protein [Delftia phage PhiW-14]